MTWKKPWPTWRLRTSSWKRTAAIWRRRSSIQRLFGPEAHCRDLERLGYPSPCPVEEVLDEVEHCPVEDSRVEELLRAREKSFQAMAEMQERCSQQQNAPPHHCGSEFLAEEMERLLQERTKLQEELSDTKQQLWRGCG